MAGIEFIENGDTIETVRDLWRYGGDTSEIQMTKPKPEQVQMSKLK